MRIGPAHWNCVSIDSAGVPHGGRYGHVDWFARQLKRYGLTLCWSRSWECFAMVRNNGGRWVWLRHLANGGIAAKPWRLGTKSLWLVLYTWNRFGEQTPAMLQSMEQEAHKRRVKEQADEMARRMHDPAMRREVNAYVERQSGRRGPAVMSIPRIVVPRMGRR